MILTLCIFQRYCFLPCAWVQDKEEEGLRGGMDDKDTLRGTVLVRVSAVLPASHPGTFLHEQF